VLIGGLGGAALSENKELVWSVWLFAFSRFVRPHAFDLALDCVFSWSLFATVCRLCLNVLKMSFALLA
jgi:hypothetical protein